MKVKLTRGLSKSKEFGKISILEFPNKSKIYISKKGWSIGMPDGIEITLNYGEINLAIKETIIQGYEKEKDRKVSGGGNKMMKCQKCGKKEGCCKYGNCDKCNNEIGGE